MAGNTLRFQTELDDKVSGKLTGISKAFDKLGGPGSGASLFGNVGAKAVAKGFDIIGRAADAAVGFIFDSVDAASRLEQSAGAVESVFGTATDSIKTFADTAATATGQSKADVSEAAAVIGAKLKGMGYDNDSAADTFINLDQRAADMAATFGGPTSDAIAAISSALTGERDPIERYGVSIKEADVKARILAMGLDTSTTAAEKNATAQATLAIIMDATKDSAGAFASQTGTLAEKQQIANAKMENAQAVLGEKLQPLFENFAQFMIDVGIPALQGIVDVFEGWGDALATVAHWLDVVNGKADTFERREFHPPTFGPPLPVFGPPVPHKAAGGWVGLDGPELVMTGENGPEYIVPNHALGNGGGVRIMGVSEREITDMIDRKMYFRLQRAAPTAVRA